MKKIFTILLLVTLILSFSGCAAESSKDVSVINTIGTGKITSKSDTLEVRFSVITQGKDKEVQQENAKKTQDVIESLVSIGLTKDEMETDNVSFHPLTRWDKDAGEQIIGYQAENSILIKTTKVDLAGRITDTAVSNGAERIGNITFNLSDEGKEKLLDEAIQKAVLDARKQAEATAKAAGVNIIGIKEINVQKNPGSSPIYLSDMRMKTAESVETPIIPQDSDYIVTVNMSFLIK